MNKRNLIYSYLLSASCIFMLNNGIIAQVQSFNQSKIDNKQSGYVLLKCSTQNCNPCKQIAPHYKALSNEINDITFMEVDVTGKQNLISKYSIRSAPTFIMFKNGKEVGRFTGGGMTKSQLKSLIQNMKPASSASSTPKAEASNPKPSTQKVNKK